jgi:hypothetical protein
MILLKYAELSAAPLPALVVAFPPVPLPLPALEVEVTKVVVVTPSVSVVVVVLVALEDAEREGVTITVVVVIPDEIVSVSVVVVVEVGDAGGQVGNVTMEEMESAVRVIVVTCAWAAAVSRASSKALVGAIIL